jgi:hydrogenase expression/formation protein HypC
MKIVDIKGNQAYAQVSGVRREVNIELLPDVKKGDYVMVHAGFAIEKVNKEEAERTLKFFKEYEDALRESFKE